MNFGSKLFTKDLSLNEAENEQKDLEKKFRPDKIGRPLGKNNKKKAEELIENTKQFYKTRNDIIEAFKKLKTEETEETKESEKSEESGDDTDLDWIYGSKDELKKMRKEVMSIKKGFNLNQEVVFVKKINPIFLKLFLKDILDDETDNEKDAVEEYFQKINNDRTLLMNSISKKKTAI